MRTIFIGLITALVLGACTPYKSQEVSFKPPSKISNMQIAAGAEVAALAYHKPRPAKRAFGFNIHKAGLLPIQVIIDNTGKRHLRIVPGQTFLIDEQGSYWNLLDRQTAYKRVEQSSEYPRIAKEAGQKSILGAAGGAIVGAAIGILTGENVGESAGKGAALGAASGSVLGGSWEIVSGEAEQQISRDLADKNLENRTIGPGILGRGFLFFPAEAPSVSKLRLQLKEKETEKVHNLIFELN